MSDTVVRAVRGATSVDGDVPEAIVASTAELLGEVLERNALRPDDLISIIFTVTEDLSSEFPAVAAREAGLTMIPLLCAREIPVPGSLGRCIRLLLHCNAPRERVIEHVYLREARRLRPDLAGDAQ
ncbi:chorismate mutase [Miltoncostaea marina]|uniref:chorismate mutase n=1 Tax=Miltoncostaea marina TaxID=2843215 RepID=UPI001C3CAEF6|nr:chorismate mutase [Miltoncostaea marina]